MGANSSNASSKQEDPRIHIKHGYENGRLPYHGVTFKEGKPTPPEDVPVVKNITHNSLTLSWTPPSGFSQKSILAYQVEIYNLRDRRWKVVCSTCQGNSYDVKNLVPDREYCFRVRAENVYGKSKPGHVSAVVRTQELHQLWTDQVPEKPQNKKIVRRHSHHLKLDGGINTLLKKTEESDTDNYIGTIPLRRNSLRGSMPLPRKSVNSCSFLPGSRRESVSSFRDSKRRSVQEEGSVTSGDDESGYASSSLPRNRFSIASSSTTTTSTTSNASTTDSEDLCNRSTSASSLMSIPEETDNEENKSPAISTDDDFLTSAFDNSDDSVWKITGPWSVPLDNEFCFSSDSQNETLKPCSNDNDNKDWKRNDNDLWHSKNSIEHNSHSHEILSAPYTDDTKLAWCSNNSPKSHLQTFKPCDDDDMSPVWKGQSSQDYYHNNMNLSDLKSLRGVLNSDDMVIKANSDRNGNYSTLDSQKQFQCCAIQEEMEEDLAMDLISAV